MALVEIPGVPRGLHTVCWYHELQRNEQDSYLPYVNVVLRSQANSYSKPYFQEIPVAIRYLGQCRIGDMVSGDGDNGFVDGTHPIPRASVSFNPLTVSASGHSGYLVVMDAGLHKMLGADRSPAESPKERSQ